MDQANIVYPDQLIPDGQLFHNRKTDRIEALLPTAYPSNHAAHLFEAENGDLLCVWFAGSEEGAADIRIVMSRLENNSAQWSEPVVVANDTTRAEQNPSLFQASEGEIWLLYTSMATRGCTLEQWQQQLDAGTSLGPFAMQHTSVIMRRISRDLGYSW